MNISTPQQRLKIGEVATLSHLPVKTVRYYEDIGLLSPNVLRSDSGYRLFDAGVLNRLAFIKRAQSLGLTLNEVKDILSVHDQGLLPCGEVKQHLQEKVEEINRKIESLIMLRTELDGILSGWNETPPQKIAVKAICPNIQTLSLK
ncbi:MAG: heavy metal-responsive transcriptional regulator [Oscillatoriales cyanobacterium C42_A2020_001]|nr:heavy metal-responsive transcriptional regulator [Leptolyngbyaceae cyanobacterium C42_A2020_001]